MLPPILVEEKHSKHPLKWLHIWGWLKSGGVSWGMRTRGASAGLIGGAPDLWGRVPAGSLSYLQGRLSLIPTWAVSACLHTWGYRLVSSFEKWAFRLALFFQALRSEPWRDGWFRHQIEHGGVGWGCHWWVSMWSLSPCSLWGHRGFIGSSDLLLCPVWDEEPSSGFRDTQATTQPARTGPCFMLSPLGFSSLVIAALRISFSQELSCAGKKICIMIYLIFEAEGFSGYLSCYWNKNSFHWYH